MAGETVSDATVHTEEGEGSWTRFTPRQRIWQVFWILLAAVVVTYSYMQLPVHYQFISSAPAQFYDLFSRMYPPSFGYTFELIEPTIETIHIAILGTIGALILSTPVAFLAAENTTPNFLTLFLGKLIVVMSRSVPTIIWAILFVAILGSGALAGVASIVVRSIGFCGKLLGEEIEEIDFDQVEGIRATGANEFDVIVYSIVPQIKPTFVGIATYRWDINVRGATILGFVGAGGIGVELLRNINTFDWSSVLMILIVILAIVLVSEFISAWARRKVR